MDIPDFSKSLSRYLEKESADEESEHIFEAVTLFSVKHNVIAG